MSTTTVSESTEFPPARIVRRGAWSDLVRLAGPRAATDEIRCAASGSRAEPAPRFLTASAAGEIGILLALSLMFPFLIHILPVPDDVRLGPKLLPMFYAPLLGALLGRTRSAIIVALAAPWLNWLLTSHPAPLGAVIMMLQLLVFVGVMRALVSAVGSRWFLAAPAYLGGLAASAAAAAIFPNLIGGRPAVAWALQNLVVGLPGIAILVAINWVAVRYLPSGPGGGDAMAA